MAMNKEHLSRLREEQDKAVSETNEKIEQWKKFKSDYEAVSEKLSTLPDSLSQDTMVSFGPLAFMPGQLVHTNEVLVLLGDNWFAKRSAKQAIDIIKRRTKQIDEQLKDLHEQKKLLMPRMTFTSELQDMAEERGDLREIMEEYDEEKEKKWKEEHRVRVREHKKKLREESLKVKTGSETSKAKPPTDEELWARLDQLEVIESQRREIERISDSEDTDSLSHVQSSKKITWEDQVLDAKDKKKSKSHTQDGKMISDNQVSCDKTDDTDSASHTQDGKKISDDQVSQESAMIWNAWLSGQNDKTGPDSDDSSVLTDDSKESSINGYTSDEEKTVSDQLPKTRITFSHTQIHRQEDDSLDSDSDKPKISSPRDIYDLFPKPTEPKSILKNKSHNSVSLPASTEELLQSEAPNIASKEKAFSGIVVETPVSTESSTSSLSSIVMDTQPTRRVSKFRAERQKQAQTPR